MSTKKEWRVSCTGKGQGHRTHHWQKNDPKKARQSVIDLNHHAEMHPDTYYRVCAPYVVESREVAPWEVVANG